jgi:chromosome segregation ATPase
MKHIIKFDDFIFEQDLLEIISSLDSVNEDLNEGLNQMIPGKKIMTYAIAGAGSAKAYVQAATGVIEKLKKLHALEKKEPSKKGEIKEAKEKLIAALKAQKAKTLETLKMEIKKLAVDKDQLGSFREQAQENIMSMKKEVKEYIESLKGGGEKEGGDSNEKKIEELQGKLQELDAKINDVESNLKDAKEESKEYWGYYEGAKDEGDKEMIDNSRKEWEEKKAKVDELKGQLDKLNQDAKKIEDELDKLNKE